MGVRQILFGLWIVGICVLAALHFIHLQADFPNYSRWMDWSKYTDEGWYANAAVQQYLRGHWNVPGDFNTAAAVPVWPFLEWMLFHFSGVSIQAARGLVAAIFCCNLLLSYLFVRKGQPQWVALFSVSMIATSSFLWCFSRLAILEPLLVCLTLSTLLLSRSVAGLQSRAHRFAAAVGMGILFCLMVLTKTTAVFLIPAILYALWEPLRNRFRTFASCAAVAGSVAGSLWLSYFFLLVHPHYLADYYYFFRINLYPKPTTVRGWMMVFYYAVHGILWIDRWIVLVGVLLLALTVAVARRTWSSPAFVTSLLAIGGYFLFVTDIDNMQPRYYAVIAFFLFFAVPIALAELWKTKSTAAIVMLAICLFAMLKGAWEIGGYVLYPEYTFVNAARGIADYVDKHPNGNRMVVSISGNDISLIAGVPSLCDDFGTMLLPDKLALYKPGWYAAWDDLDAGSLEDLRTQYSVEAVAKFAAFDDDDRDTLVLYKLIPAKGSATYYKNDIYHQMP